MNANQCDSTGAWIGSLWVISLIYPGNVFWGSPSCSFQATPPCFSLIYSLSQALWRCLLMQLQYSSDDYRAALPELLGLSYLAQQPIDGTWKPSVIYGTRPKNPSPPGSQICTKLPVTSALLRASGEGTVLRVHLACHEFDVQMWANSIWQEWPAHTGSLLLMSCLEGGRLCFHWNYMSIRISGRAKRLEKPEVSSQGSWQWHHVSVWHNPNTGTRVCFHINRDSAILLILIYEEHMDKRQLRKEMSVINSFIKTSQCDYKILL